MSIIPGKWQRVTRSHPCVVCGKPDNCSISADGALAACRRQEAGCWRTKTGKDGTPVHLHRLDGTARPPATPPLPSTGTAPDRADADTLHRVYSAILAALPLSAAHRANLSGRGLSDGEIDARGYGTLPIQGRARIAGELRQRFGDGVLRVPGIVTRERDGRRYLSIAGAAGLLAPVRDVAGRVVALQSRRDGPTDASIAPRYSYMSSLKYGGAGSGAPVHVPRGVTGPCHIVRVTEGALKGDIAHARTGLPTIGLPGVASWRPALPILQALGAKTVRLALDADAADKGPVARALAAIAEGLAAEGLTVELERWPAPHKGIDDALAADAAIEVVTGDDARRAVAEIVAEGTAAEPLPAPSALDRLADVIADGGAEAVYRDGELLRALAALAEADPAEYMCRRAQLQRAGIRLRDLDKALAPLRRTLRAAQPPPDAAGAYRVVGGRIVHERPTPQGPVEVPLATWAGRIVEEVIRDDGAERTVTLAVEGALQDGTPLPRVEVAGDDFGFMRWPVSSWGTRAVVMAGASTADHLRVALQLLSGDVPRKTVYGHTGWRDVAGQSVYLHAGGAIGEHGPASDIAVSLPDPLAGYILPDPPTGQALVDAIRASLRVLDLAPDRITVPLLGAVYRVVLGPCDSALHLAGPTGTGKSELAALAQQHHGAGLDARHLPASWASTGNSLEGLAFAAAHALMVVDDFAPGGSTADVARMHREADRLLRAQGNRSGRMRMRADATLRPVKPPRGMILSTGEDIPRGQSLRARLLTLELAPGELDWPRVTAAQADAAAGRYAEALGGYLRWLAARYVTVRDGLPAEVAALRDRAHAEGLHARTPGIVADLAAGWRWWLDYALSAGAIRHAERDAMDKRVWAALQEAGAGQAEHVAAAEPCGHFLRLLADTLASGRAHCAGPDGNEPADADAWGWRLETVGAGQSARDICRPRGHCIGWIDAADLYIQPEAAYAEAQELARQMGDALPIGGRTLWRRMHERGLLASRDAARERYTVRRTVGGVTSRDVIHLRADALSSAPLPSKPSNIATAPHPGRAATVDSSASPTVQLDGATVQAPSDRPSAAATEPRDSGCAAAHLDGLDGLDGQGAIYPPAGTDIIPPSPCRYPAHRRRWRSVHGVVLCGECVPPIGPHVVAEWLDGPPTQEEGGQP
jgi:hypothetical protein